jgi:hypothetical protein
MLRACTVACSSALAQSANTKTLLTPIVSRVAAESRTKAPQTLATKYETLFKASFMDSLLQLEETNIFDRYTLYAERKNKTARKVAKKHRKKKGKTVNMRRN